MIIRTLALPLAIACTLWACTTAAPGPRPDPAEIAPDEAPLASVERFIEPTPAMLAAALSGDPSRMQASTALSGCPAPSTCPTEFGSCTGWSAPSACNLSCVAAPLCSCPIGPQHPDYPSEPCEPDPEIGRAITTSSSFRVCFNSAQQACTEWKQSFSSHCGC